MIVRTPNPQEELLGSGSFGTVFRLQGLPIARKYIRLPQSGGGLPPEGIREIACLRRLRNYSPSDRRNCIDVLHIEISKTNIMLDLELMTGGTLGELLSEARLGPELALSYSVQILRGLQFLHDVGITHRDLKPNNILLSSPNGLKIADFGLSHVISGCEPRTPLVCTLYYRPPELLRANVFLNKVRGLTYTSAIDNWSAGCILREMIVGLGPVFRPARTIYSSTTSSIEQLDAIIKKFYLSSGFINEKLATSFCNSTLKLPEITISPPLMNQILEVTQLLLIPNPEFRCAAGTALKTLEQLDST
ncbi:Putative serine/threonine-protein kinase, active [Colletotrichum destructivum]|uniref:Serine/threonine-protein kinase, active n=1 Tax=Colletotrichum destructivum TaxID=34406 RepID=A0AAX4J471_9PEZI|nr:Putative serine/threonine-protein kinase, active [Colletotrichum destructivum]